MKSELSGHSAIPVGDRQIQFRLYKENTCKNELMWSFFLKIWEIGPQRILATWFQSTSKVTVDELKVECDQSNKLSFPIH